MEGISSRRNGSITLMEIAKTIGWKTFCFSALPSIAVCIGRIRDGGGGHTKREIPALDATKPCSRRGMVSADCATVAT